MARCIRCGKLSFFQGIDRNTGLCKECINLEKAERAKSTVYSDNDLNNVSRQDIEAMGFDADNFDGYDMLDAQSILKNRDEANKSNPKLTVVKADEGEVPFDVPVRRNIGKVDLEYDALEYNYPPIDLLATSGAEDIRENASRDMEKARLLEDTLHSFGIQAKLTGIAHGPAVTRFELQLPPSIKISRITSLTDDIALNLAAMSVRVEAPILGKSVVGVEIPNDKVEMVHLRDVLESDDARKHPSKIAVGLGKDNNGRYIVADIAKMPHVLISGQTGSGKSMCINDIIASILFRASPEDVRLILIDPKMVELSVYNNIPHLICPVITDPEKASNALDWVIVEIEKRYRLFGSKGVKDIQGYNKALGFGEKLMPRMVIIIDEFSDLMEVFPKKVEASMCKIGQLGYRAGIHMVITTYHPAAQIITSAIRNCIPARIAFSTASGIDSRMIIGESGAEELRGNGDMLFAPYGMKSIRVQGSYISDDEVHAIANYIKQSGEAEYDPNVIKYIENPAFIYAETEEFASEYDPKLPEAVDIVMDMGQASISMIQRRMRIGYARTGRIIDEMAKLGIISKADGAKPRKVLITREEAQAMFNKETID